MSSLFAFQLDADFFFVFFNAALAAFCLLADPEVAFPPFDIVCVQKALLAVTDDELKKC